MRIFLLATILLVLKSGYSQELPDGYTVRDLKQGDYADDTSYVYALPYESGKSYLLVQAYDSKNYSHQNEFSLDFKMRPGTKILAAREGIVTEIKEDSDAGGVNAEFLDDGNHIVIQHNDGTFAGYWHLQKNGAQVNKGDFVSKGEWIGLSGNTGYTAFPHLHFWVYYRDGKGNLKTIPTRFQTRKGIRYLRPGFSYQAKH